MPYLTCFRHRLDLSEWVIHFVHQHTGVEDLNDFAEACALEGHPTEDCRYPDYYDGKGNPQNILDTYTENEIELTEGASGFEVLKKILHDGYIHSGWSYRNDKPTVYGPVSAVCFTEMPLFALVEYAKVRGKISNYVGGYGIAFRRNELFAAGARPVIYGSSGKCIETDVDANGVHQGRMLDEVKSGIGKYEQYRFVPTYLTKDPHEKNIDWMMEREWRWPLPFNKTGVPGLPFFLSKEYADYFTEIYIIVSKDEEAAELAEYLTSLYNSGSTNRGLYYNITMISSARIISLESLIKLDNSSILKLDTVPITQMRIPPHYAIMQKELTSALSILKEAEDVADDAILEYLKHHPEYDDNIGYWGFANVITYDYSEFVQALVDSGKAHTYSDGAYYLGQMSSYRSENLELLEVGAAAAAKYLTAKLGKGFHVHTRLD